MDESNQESGYRDDQFLWILRPVLFAAFVLAHLECRRVKTIILLVGCLVLANPQALVAQTISLNRYLDLIRSRHPFFRQEALAHEIALKRQERIRGDEDWEIVVNPSYTYNDVVEVGFGTVDQFENARLETGIG